MRIQVGGVHMTARSRLEDISQVIFRKINQVLIDNTMKSRSRISKVVLMRIC
jgi:hypothetical protein